LIKRPEIGGLPGGCLLESQPGLGEHRQAREWHKDNRPQPACFHARSSTSRCHNSKAGSLKLETRQSTGGTGPALEPTATTRAPAACAASIPVRESSKTTQFAGVTPKSPAVFK